MIYIYQHFYLLSRCRIQLFGSVGTTQTSVAKNLPILEPAGTRPSTSTLASRLLSRQAALYQYKKPKCNCTKGKFPMNLNLMCKVVYCVAIRVQLFCKLELSFFLLRFLCKQTPTGHLKFVYNLFYPHLSIH